MSGLLTAKIQDGKFNLQVSPSALSINARFRKEFSRFRLVTEWIATSLLGSRVSSYLEKKPISFEVPRWDLGDGMQITMRDLQLWKYSTRIPLEFKNNK